jgi:hypothetical protein
MKRTTLFLLAALGLFPALVVAQGAPSLGLCLNPSLQWIPIHAIINGTSSLPGPSIQLYGKNNGVPYPIACDSSGNISAGAILGYTIPSLAAGCLQSAGITGPLSWGTCGSSGGVTQITAGTNVTISPSGGTGNVTINASGGGSGTVSGQANGVIPLATASIAMKRRSASFSSVAPVSLSFSSVGLVFHQAEASLVMKSA